MHTAIFLTVLAGAHGYVLGHGDDVYQAGARGYVLGHGDDVYQAHCEFQGAGVGELSGEIIINEFPDGKETE